MGSGGIMQEAYTTDNQTIYFNNFNKTEFE